MTHHTKEGFGLGAILAIVAIVAVVILIITLSSNVPVLEMVGVDRTSRTNRNAVYAELAAHEPVATFSGQSTGTVVAGRYQGKLYLNLEMTLDAEAMYAAFIGGPTVNSQKLGTLAYDSETDTWMLQSVLPISEALNRYTTIYVENELDGSVVGQTELAAEIPEVVIEVAELADNLFIFSQERYDAARAENKTILLYFYASWCPICAEETATALYPAFDELDQDQVIGFRVNFNDGDTSSEEEALAREYGVAYQHTKVLIANGEQVLKSPESWSKETYITTISDYQN